MNSWNCISIPPDSSRVVQVRLKLPARERRVAIGYYNDSYWEVLYGYEFVPASWVGLIVETWKDLDE